MTRTTVKVIATADTQVKGIKVISSSAEPGECVPNMEAHCFRFQPHIIGLPFLTVTRRSTTLMLLDDTLIRMTVLSCYMGIIHSLWSHWTFSVFHWGVWNLIRCWVLTSALLLLSHTWGKLRGRQRRESVLLCSMSVFPWHSFRLESLYSNEYHKWNKKCPSWTSVFSTKKYRQHILSELQSRQSLLLLPYFDISLKYMVIFDKIFYIWLLLGAYFKKQTNCETTV